MKKLLLFLMAAFSLQAQISTQKVVSTTQMRDANSPITSLTRSTWTDIILGTNGILMGTTGSRFFNDAGFSLIVKEGNNQILQLVTNGEFTVISPNFPGSTITLRPRSGGTGIFATNPIITFNGNSDVGNIGFGKNPNVGNATAFHFDTQIVVTNDITSLAFIDILGATPQLTFQPTKAPGGAFLKFVDDFNPTSVHSCMGFRSNETAFTYRSTAASMYLGTEEFRIDVGQVTVSNNFRVGGTILYAKGLNVSVTNNGVGSTNIEVFGSGILTNRIYTGP